MKYLCLVYGEEQKMREAVEQVAPWATEVREAEVPPEPIFIEPPRPTERQIAAAERTRRKRAQVAERDRAEAQRKRDSALPSRGDLVRGDEPRKPKQPRAASSEQRRVVIGPKELRAAFAWREILSPPVCLRRDESTII